MFRLHELVLREVISTNSRALVWIYLDDILLGSPDKPSLLQVIPELLDMDHSLVPQRLDLIQIYHLLSVSLDLVHGQDLGTVLELAFADIAPELVQVNDCLGGSQGL